MGNPKALFYDLDGTIYFSKGVYPENVTAFRQAQENGHKIILNTGRAKGYVPDDVTDRVNFDGFCCGSAYIEIGGKVILNDTLSEDVLLRLKDFADMAKVPMCFEGINGAWGYRSNFAEKELNIDDHYEEFAKTEKITKLSFFCPTKYVTPYIHDEHIDGIPELRLIVFPTYCEAILTGHSKATALQRTCEYFGIDIKDSVAFGDSENDRDMLLAAGTAVVMNRAPDSLKAIADYVPSEDHRGCAIAMKALGII